jgi:hypothetical protein
LCYPLRPPCSKVKVGKVKIIIDNFRWTIVV